MAHDRREVPLAIRRIGGLPAILKLIQGTQGVGVMIAHTLAEIESILDTMKDLGQEILLQEFIREAKGRDIRALVIGDHVVGAMRRKAQPGEFRANLHQGGEGKPIALSKEMAEVAVRAVRILGLELAGVDMLESKSGPKIMEVNSSPGFEGLERTTGLDIAGMIVDHALEFASARATGWNRPRLI
jgi:ribosomal protein S6--L-glutamate ligase